ncbi:hypothetical protein GCM10025853_03680 [Tetragenococcus halophilus subsp. halophilus DSM 20339]|nr:hypothetical protein GCM10025853_03680 [Tetragenococcus halophilus subsp. halophilus DSM 20339]
MIGAAYATPIKACQNTRLSLRTSRILTAFLKRQAKLISILTVKLISYINVWEQKRFSVLNKLYVAILFFGTKKGRFRVIICVLCLFKFLKY